MQKVDLVIGGLGVVAIIATTLGVALYEEGAGERTVRFPEGLLHEHDTDEAEQSDRGAGSLEYEKALRNNATLMRDMVVTFTFTGETGVPTDGTGSYEVRITPPGNQTCEGKIEPWSEDRVTVAVPDCRLAQPPESVRTTDVGSVGQTLVWNEDFIFEIIITDPDDPLAVEDLPLGGVEYTYDVDVAYKEYGYRATVEQPDVSSR